jgi:glucosylceramidase
MQKSRVISVIILLFMFHSMIPLSYATSEVTWIVTTEAEPWRNGGMVACTEAVGGKYTIEIDTETICQEIDGFGGCFNERGWAALSMLTPAQREEALQALFDPETGAGFNICRVPIGASDYALDRYTLNEVKDDFQMEHFSIERDKDCLIPYIKAAMKYKPDLKIWGSVWTPPTWMKTNGQFDGGKMKDDPKIYDAYALYLARFLETYREEGINAYAVAIQTEPSYETNYPSCAWNKDQFLTFIRNHIGPLFEERNVPGEIWLGTIADKNYTFTKTSLKDPVANRYITTVGYQWDGVFLVAETRKEYPEKRIMQTETECGNFYWTDGFDPEKPQNDWNYAVHTWNKVKEYFTKGVNSYLLWNMVLDETGKNLDSVRPWPQNAALVVDTKTKSLIYTPMYYAFKHFSHFVKPGAYFLGVKARSGWSDTLAFLNPDGKVILVLQNAAAKERPVRIKMEDQAVAVTLPPKSWSTLVLP